MVDIAALRPTQFAIGYWEVDRRAEKLSGAGKKKLDRYLDQHIAQIVVGPGGEPYLIDRHHLAFLMQRTGLRTAIPAIVNANFSAMPVDSFWKAMINNKWVYLYDARGKGPLEPNALPDRIADLADDPYRSLAWAVRKRDGYRKTDSPFAEFAWANFFRSRIVIDSTKSSVERAIPAALGLCRSSDASGLPGFLTNPDATDGKETDD